MTTSSPEVPRRFKLLAIAGWIVLVVASLVVAQVMHWPALTEGLRPWILLFAGVPYFAVVAVIASVVYPESREHRGLASKDDGLGSSSTE